MDANDDALDSVRLLEEHGVEKERPQNAHPRVRWTWPIRNSTTIIILLVVLNVILLYGGSSLPWHGKNINSDPDRNYFSAVPTVPVPFSHQWVGLDKQEFPGYRYKDEEWTDLFPTYGGIVALSSKFRAEHHLPENAAPAPEDEDKGLYYIAGYHQLHCLKIVRDAVYYLNGTIPWPDSDGFVWDHVLHCIEAVRLGLTCFLDPTLINLNETWPGIPNGQTHECRNRDALRAFGDEHGHLAPVDPESVGM